MSTEEGKLELDLMRGKQQSFRQKMGKVLSLSYDCVPLNQQQYSQAASQLFESMKSIDPNQKDPSQHDEIILGKIQGQPAVTNFKQVIESIVGEVNEDKFKAYLKQKTQQRNFGLTIKDRNCSVRQIKKLQTLKKYFDVNQISKKRKFNKLYSVYIKSLGKYLDLYDKINQADLQTIQKAFQQYNNCTKDQKKFIAYSKQLETVENIVQRPLIADEEPILQTIRMQNLIRENIAVQEQHKISDVQAKKMQKNIDEQKKSSQQNDNKTPKKNSSNKKKNQSKKKEDVVPQLNAGQMTQKQKNLSQQKQKNEEKQRQKSQKLQKQRNKQKLKKSNNKSITDYFCFKKKQTTTDTAKNIISEDEPKIDIQSIAPQNITQTYNLHPKASHWDNICKKCCQTQLPSICSLRSQFRGFKMENQQLPNQPYYINMVITLSTIEYYDYLMQLTKQVNFRVPFEKIRDVLYFQDQSQQFQGQSAQQQAQSQEQDSGQISGNNTILNDDHLSFEQVSSCDSHEVNLKVEYGNGRKWMFNFRAYNPSVDDEQQQEILEHFAIICLESEQKMPLKLDEQEEKFELVMTPELWRDIYRIAHGYHGTKESIIKDISSILPGVSKNWIDSMLKQRSQKIQSQRYIKKDFIDDVKQKITQIDALLQSALQERNQQLRKVKAQKNYQRDQKLEKDIFQCTGSRYIVNLLKQLKEKGYKQLRRTYLTEFISERRGEEWQKLKTEINTMSRRPIDQMIRMMPVGAEKIDQQVQVQDDQYNNSVQKRDCQHKNNQQGQNDSKLLMKQKGQDNLQLDQMVRKKMKSAKKSQQQAKNPKQSLKAKRRKDKSSKLTNTYEKTKPINRARNTKNSLKTGILSIDQLKKKRHQAQNQQNQEQQQSEGPKAIQINVDLQQQEQIQNPQQQNQQQAQNTQQLNIDNPKQKDIILQQQQLNVNIQEYQLKNHHKRPVIIIIDDQQQVQISIIQHQQQKQQLNPPTLQSKAQELNQHQYKIIQNPQQKSSENKTDDHAADDDKLLDVQVTHQ